MVAALEEAMIGELAPQVVAGNGLVPGSPERLADKPDLCSGSRPRAHSHFFTESGAFGSLDWERRPVDDGTYEVIDDDKVAIGPITLSFEITGNTITFEVAEPKSCKTDECRMTQAYAVAVAFPGKPWKRVD